MATERIKAVLNLVVEIILVGNLILQAQGKNPLPVDQEAVYEFISYLLAGLQTIRVWWKNQNLTPEACEGTGLTHMLKDQKRSNYEATEVDEDVEQISKEL